MNTAAFVFDPAGISIVIGNAIYTASFAVGALRLVHFAIRMHRRVGSRHEVMHLNDHMLADIGLSRSEIPGATREQRRNSFPGLFH